MANFILDKVMILRDDGKNIVLQTGIKQVTYLLNGLFINMVKIISLWKFYKNVI